MVYFSKDKLGENVKTLDLQAKNLIQIVVKKW